MSADERPVVYADWRERLENPPRPRTLPELMLVALDVASEDSRNVEVANGRSARAEFAKLVGYDLFDALRGIIVATFEVATRAPRTEALQEALTKREDAVAYVLGMAQQIAQEFDGTAPGAVESRAEAVQHLRALGVTAHEVPDVRS